MQTDGESRCYPERTTRIQEQKCTEEWRNEKLTNLTQGIETYRVDTSLKNSSVIHDANFVAFS